jgi:hypothetical protein
MTVMHATRAIRLTLRIETENHPYDLTPIGPFFFGIEQPQIGLEVPLVVRRDVRQVGGTIIKWEYGHGENPRRSHTENDPREQYTLASYR